MRHLIQLAAQRVLDPAPDLTGMNAVVSFDEHLIPLDESQPSIDRQTFEVNAGEIDKIQRWLNTAFETGPKTFFLKKGNDWHLLYWVKGAGWYYLDSQRQTQFIQKYTTLNLFGQDFFQPKALTKYEFIPATPERVSKLVKALGASVVQVQQQMPQPEPARPQPQVQPQVQPEAQNGGVFSSIFSGIKQGVESVIQTAQAVMPIKMKASRNYAGLYERTTTQGIMNDCSEVAIENAAERLGLGKIRITYATKHLDQVDATPAFASAPDSEKFQWYSVDKVDFTILDKTAVYIALKGTAGDQGGGHWQTLYYCNIKKGWILKDEFSTHQLTGEDSELTVEGYQYLGCQSSRWGQAEGQQSLCLTKASEQLIINATNFIVAYREKDPKEDELNKDILSLQIYKLTQNDIAFFKNGKNAEQILDELIEEAGTEVYSAGSTEKKRYDVAKKIKEYIRPGVWERVLVSGAYQSVKQSAGIVAVKVNQTQLKAKIVQPPEQKRAQKEILGTRRQVLDIMVSRLNAWLGNRANRNPVTIRFIESKSVGQGIPKKQEANVLNHSFGLSETTQSNEIRHLSKWRAVTSEVKLLANEYEFFDEMQLFMMVTSGTLPNIQGSNEVDTKRYLRKSGDELLLIETDYLSDVREILEAWLQEQDKAKVKTVVLPISWCRTDEVNAELKNAIHEFLSRSEHVHTVYAVSTESEEDDPYIIRICKGGNSVADFELMDRTPGKKCEVLDVIYEIKKDLMNDKTRENERIGLINPVPDNCMGGQCAIQKDPNTHRAYTRAHAQSQDLYVNLADFSTYLLHQTMDFNASRFNMRMWELNIDPQHKPYPPFPKPSTDPHVHPAEERRLQEKNDHASAQALQNQLNAEDRLTYTGIGNGHNDAGFGYAHRYQGQQRWYIPVLKMVDLTKRCTTAEIDAFSQYMYDHKLTGEKYHQTLHWLLAPSETMPEDVKQTLQSILNTFLEKEDQKELAKASRERQRRDGPFLCYLPKFNSLDDKGKMQDLIQLRSSEGEKVNLEQKREIYNKALRTTYILIGKVCYTFETNIVNGQLLLNKKINVDTHDRSNITHEDKVAYLHARADEKHLIAVLMDICRDAETAHAWKHGKQPSAWSQYPETTGYRKASLKK